MIINKFNLSIVTLQLLSKTLFTCNVSINALKKCLHVIANCKDESLQLRRIYCGTCLMSSRIFYYLYNTLL